MRELKFRAWQDGVMLTQPIPGIYAMKRFLGLLYEDAELMQFTGLKDKNGVEIYEGDIVNAWIDYGPGGEGKHIFSVSIHPHGCSIEEWNFKEDGFLPEVIGNVHQHPELIK